MLLKELKPLSHHFPNMILLDITRLLWVTCQLPGYFQAHTHTLSVHQYPGRLTVTEGERVNITCVVDFQCANYTDIRLDFSWINDNRTTMFRASGEACFSSLTLGNVRKNQSGLYVCKVIIDRPRLLGEGQGNGTQLLITDSDVPKMWVMLWALTVLFPLLLVVVAMIYRFKSHQTREQRTQNRPTIPCAVPQESTFQNTTEITYASINTQQINQRENQQRHLLERVKSGSQDQRSPVEEEQVLYSAVRLKQAA